MTWAIVFGTSLELTHHLTPVIKDGSSRSPLLRFAAASPFCPNCEVALDWKESETHFILTIVVLIDALLVTGMAAKYWSPPPSVPQ